MKAIHSAGWLRLRVVLAAMGCALAGCDRRGNAAAPPQGMPPPLVVTTEVVAGDVPVYLDEIGKCAARESVSIQPQVTGRVQTIHFVDGADLKPGDPLFTIDPRPYEAQLKSAEAAVAQARASLALAKIEFDRVKDLPRAVEPEADYDTKKNAIDVADAQVQAGLAAVETATINLNYCTIRSPIQGRAGQRLVDVGNVVIGNAMMMGNGSNAMLMIQRLDPIYADFTITEGNLPAVQENMARGTLKALVRRPADMDSRSGELTFLDNAVQDGSGTVKLRATLPNGDHRFWPGQFVFVRLVLYTQKDAMLVPAQAVQTGQQGQYVYVVKDGEKGKIAELRPIVPGQKQADKVVIKSGVQAGETVIVEGQMLVMPGGPVNARPFVAATQPSSQPAALSPASNAVTNDKYAMTSDKSIGEAR